MFTAFLLTADVGCTCLVWLLRCRIVLCVVLLWSCTGLCREIKCTFKMQCVYERLRQASEEYLCSSSCFYVLYVSCRVCSALYIMCVLW